MSRCVQSFLCSCNLCCSRPHSLAGWAGILKVFHGCPREHKKKKVNSSITFKNKGGSANTKGLKSFFNLMVLSNQLVVAKIVVQG